MLSSRSIIFLFSLLFLSALNDLTGPSAGPLAQITYTIPIPFQLSRHYGRKWDGSVMVSSLLLPAFGTLSLLLYFWLPSKGRSITTLGMIIFYYPFLDILYFCFILFIAFLFLFLRDADSRTVFPVIKIRKGGLPVLDTDILNTFLSLNNSWNYHLAPG